ncbi:hypothetical protein LXA47_04170 [Massilia sp. P8910]|uniref:hypothetical protein n=1 Tax=Massilia antarctica TaxID=2765360 RepID=UPI001E636632|nr:hypothetical protein [Massilia antarctica]MCE3602795.1 hypothetical protein [Massilia antarctica]
MSNSFDSVSRFGSVPGAGFMGNSGVAKSGAWLQELERAALGNRPQAAASEAPGARGAAPQAHQDPGLDPSPHHLARQAAEQDPRRERAGQGEEAATQSLAAAAGGQPAVQAAQGVAAAAPAPAAPGQGQVQGAPATAELAHVGLLTMGLAAPVAAPAAPTGVDEAAPSLSAGAMPGVAPMANPAMRAAAAALPGESALARVGPAAAPPPARLAARAPMLKEQAEASEAAPERTPASGGESAADELPYALRSMHLFHDGEGVQAWIRDAALSQFQANALAYSLKKEMQAEGLTLQALTLNGKKTAMAPAPPEVKRK